MSVGRLFHRKTSESVCLEIENRCHKACDITGRSQISTWTIILKHFLAIKLVNLIKFYIYITMSWHLKVAVVFVFSLTRIKKMI